MAAVVVAGGGLAGLVAAVQARQLGARVTVLEKGKACGGNALLSSGFIYRYQEFEEFRRQCPGGDEALQRIVWKNLDKDLRWLEELGAPVVKRSTSNPLTAGVGFDMRGLFAALERQAGEIKVETPLIELPGKRTVLATGGFAGNPGMVRDHIGPAVDELALRAIEHNTGDGLQLALDAGGELTAGMDEFYGRAMPQLARPYREAEFVPLAQVYARHAEVTNVDGDTYMPRTWSETDVVQWMARQPGATANLSMPVEGLDNKIRDRTVGEIVAAAEAAGAKVKRNGTTVKVPVQAAITTTLGGLGVDENAQVTDRLWACGEDIGGIATGGYCSGLASALVFGRIAGRSAALG